MNEACNVCHGGGRTADVNEVHNLVPKFGTATFSDVTVSFADWVSGPTCTTTDPWAAAVVGTGSTSNGCATIRFKPSFTTYEGELYTPDLKATSFSTRYGNSLKYLRFSIAKLEPAAAAYASPTWQTYSGGESVPDNFVGPDVDGYYTYTYTRDFNAAGMDFDATAKTRAVITLSGLAGFDIQHEFKEFVPDGSANTDSREIVQIGNCNECHGKLRMHGSRTDTRLCVECHNPSMTTAGGISQENGNFPVLIHKVHTAQVLPFHRDPVDGTPTPDKLWDYSEITFPAWNTVANCRKCHEQSTATPEGDNWKNKPSAVACGSCHTAVNFATGTGHGGGAQADDSGCAGCHANTLAIGPEQAHRTDNATTHNPVPATGLHLFKYTINEATVDGTTNQVTIKFKIEKDNGDGVFADFDIMATNAAFTGGPSFLLAYAMPQDGVDAPTDWNNLGRTAGQPQTVSIANLKTADGIDDTVITGSPAEYTVKIPLPGAAGIATSAQAEFPAGATLRTVGLQGYYTQAAVGTPPANVGRHTRSVLKTVTGDTARRTTVEMNKCLNCHETLEGHGGNRVDDPMICLTCHNPNLTSSGRAVDPVLLAAQKAGPVGAANPAGYTGTISQGAFDQANNTSTHVGDDPLLYPEEGMQFKYLIHALHGSAKRTTPFEFVRDRSTSGIYYYDFAEVTYPGILSNCQTCHTAPTSSLNVYDTSLPAGVLMTTMETTNAADPMTRQTVRDSRASVPNATDVVASPTAGACYGCHDSVTATYHFGQNGGIVGETRSQALGQ